MSKEIKTRPNEKTPSNFFQRKKTQELGLSPTTTTPDVKNSIDPNRTPKIAEDGITIQTNM